MNEAKFLEKIVENVREYVKDDSLVEKMVEDMFLSFQVKTIVTDPDFPDYRITPPFNPQVVAWTRKNWKPQPEDVLVASFPKTGTTWTREIVRSILYKDSPLDYKKGKVCEDPFLAYLEAGSSKKYEIVDKFGLDRRVWGTHLPSELLNMDNILESGAKVIYVMRNPKDTLVSSKPFFEKMPFMKYPEIKKYFPDDMNEYVKAFVGGKLPIYMKDNEWYPHHIKSWMKFKDNPNIHFVFFEDLKLNPNAEIKKIADHLGVIMTDVELNKIVEMTSFNKMKSSAANMLKELNFFRKGEVGNWKNHLDPEMSQLIDVEMKKGLGDLNVDFTYSI